MSKQDDTVFVECDELMPDRCKTCCYHYNIACIRAKCLPCERTDGKRGYFTRKPAEQPAPVGVATGSAVCSECGWTNVNLLNLGEPGKPRMVCHGCCKRTLKAVDACRAKKPAEQPATASIEQQLRRTVDMLISQLHDAFANQIIEQEEFYVVVRKAITLCRHRYANGCGECHDYQCRACELRQWLATHQQADAWEVTL